MGSLLRSLTLTIKFHPSPHHPKTLHGASTCVFGWTQDIQYIVESGPCHEEQRNNNNMGTKISRGREAAVPMESSQEQTPLH